MAPHLIGGIMPRTMLYVTNGGYEVTGGTQVPLGTAVRGYGSKCCPSIEVDGGVVSLVGAGYYSILSSMTFTPTSTGPVTATFYQDGAAIPGATVTVQGTAATPVGLFVVGEVRNTRCSCSSSITCVISADGVLDNIATRFEGE